MINNETILVFSAHSDDFVIGAGGTIANYTAEGKEVITIIFSSGEKSHPWMKGRIIKQIRLDETKKAGSILGCETISYDLKDQSLYEDYHEQGIQEKLLKLIRTKNLSKIFTHSDDDIHSDHKAVHKITLELYDLLKKKPEVYIYSIWNPISFKTNHPALLVNITSSFRKKLKALKEFKSQRYNAIYPLLILIFHRAIRNGLKIHTWFGEKFYRIK